MPQVSKRNLYLTRQVIKNNLFTTKACGSQVDTVVLKKTQKQETEAHVWKHLNTTASKTLPPAGEV